MKLAKGPRPWSIYVFAVAFLGAALHDYAFWLHQLPIAQTVYELQFPWSGWNRDWTIVALSATLTIAFIPVVWIFAFASRIARWLVTGFSIIQLLDVPQKLSIWLSSDVGINPGYFANPALITLALICLFLPPSNRWLAKKLEVDHAVFD